MASVQMTLEEWRAFEIALAEARGMVVDLAPESPVWDESPERGKGEAAEAYEHRTWSWRFERLRGSRGVEPGAALAEAAPVAPPPSPAPARSNASAIAEAIAASRRP
jgi:hypothetical protein